MATVIDALVVTLGLDPKEFTKGQKEAAAALLKTRKAAEKEAKEIERSLDRASEGFDRLIRNALKLFAVFTTGRAVKDFISDITASDAAVGRLAKSLETTPEALTALGGAVSRSGGSADAAAGSFSKLANSYNEMKLTGRSATYDMLSRLQGATGKVIHYGKDTQRTLYDIADAAKAMSEKAGVSFTTNLLEQAGLDPGTIALLVQGSDKLREAQEKVKRLGGVLSKADTENAQRFSTAMHDVGTISEGLGRTIWTNLSPAISEIIEKVIKWYEANGEWLRSQIAEKVKQLADYLRSIDWNGIGQAIKDFATGANDAAKAVGGWKVVFEGLLGAWLFTKLFALLRVLGLIRLAITGSATPGIFGSLLGALGIGGTAAVGAAVGTAIGADAAVPNAAKPGVSNHWDDEASGAAGGAGMGGVFRRGGRWLKRKLGIGGGASSEAGAATGTAGSLTALYEAEAKRAGIDPRILHGIRAGESLHSNSYDVKSDSKEDSYGPFQLNRRGGLGAEFEKETGLDLHDPKTIPAQTRWVAELIKKRGPGVLSQWYGYKGPRDADPSWGESGYTPSQDRKDIPAVNGAGGVDQRQGNAQHRTQGISDVLGRQISAAAAAAGVNAEVFSGGQDPAHQYGSTRHNHGNAADLKLYTTGPNGQKRYLDMTNEADRVVMEKFIRESVKAGANGVGAAPNYMGAHGIHVGGGSPAAWGAGGSTANAPEWVRRAHQQGMEDRLVAAAAAAKAAKQAPMPDAPPKPEAAFDAARRAGAAASVAQANAANAAVVSRTSNDNRSAQDNRRYDETHLHNVNVYPANGTQSSIMAELKQASKGGKAFAAAADYGKA
ncbi:hypothetical protein ACQKQD_18500 [Methylobacterium sp. NPDC080182]|uniref:hypothetical protein n=1 Tax=Methylobacterium sp. NPDC080182 TaxID=3390590 RepID=UPI003D08882D